MNKYFEIFGCWTFPITLLAQPAPLGTPQTRAGVSYKDIKTLSIKHADKNNNGLVDPHISGGSASDLLLANPSIIGTMKSINGSIQSIYYEVPAISAEISLGTQSKPITKMGPSLRVSRTEDLTTSGCQNTYNNNECNAAIVGASRATAEDRMQGTGVIGVAVGEQTHKEPDESLDTVGVQGQGRVINQGVGVGTGGFFQGIDESSRGRAIGIESNIKNLSGKNAAPNISDGGSFPNILASCGAGTWKPQFRCNSGLQITNSGSDYNYGVVVTNAVVEASFVDNSNAKTGLLISGKHLNQISGTNFNVNSYGSLFIGDRYDYRGQTPLNVIASRSKLVYISSLGPNDATVNIDEQLGGRKSILQFNDKSSPKWGLGKDIDNSFFVYDNHTETKALSIQPGGGLYVFRGVDFPVFRYIALPASPELGQTVFCKDCYSAFRPKGSSNVGILVVFSNGEWEDMIGNRARHDINSEKE